MPAFLKKLVSPSLLYYPRRNHHVSALRDSHCMLVCCLCHFLKLEHAEGAGLVFLVGLHRRQKPHPGLWGKGHRLLGFAVLQLCIERAVPREAAE